MRSQPWFVKAMGNPIVHGSLGRDCLETAPALTQRVPAVSAAPCQRSCLSWRPQEGERSKQRAYGLARRAARTRRIVLHRLGAGLVPGRFAVWRGMLDLGVDLAPDQHAQPGQIEPGEKDNHRAKTAIGFVVRPKVVDIQRKAERDEQGRHDRKDRPGRNPLPRCSTSGAK